MTLGHDELEGLRSLLFVPATEPRFLRNIAQRGAGAIILDLEDAVAPSRKDEARSALDARIAQLKSADLVTVVRVNAGSMEDIDAAVSGGADAVLLPKVCSAQDIQIAAERLHGTSSAADSQQTRLLALIETPEAVMHLPEITRASDALIGVILGGEDLCAALGTEPSEASLGYAASRLVMAARAAGIVPLGVPGPLSLIEDSAAFQEVVRHGQRLGMAGTVCIHPRQVAVINAVYADSIVSYADALSIVEAFDRAMADGKGAVMWRGRMLDPPIVERAKKIATRGH